MAPAHNPPYIAAMRLLSEKLPEIPLVAAFETGFHQTIPDRESLLCRPARVGRRVSRPALGLSRREPSLHRHADGRTARAATICGSSPAIWAARVRCVRFATDERGHQHGHEPANRACRTTTAWAISIRLRLPVIMRAHRPVAGRSAERSGRTERAVGPQRHRAATCAIWSKRPTPGNAAGPAGAGCVHRPHSALSGRVSGRAGRGRCDRLHRRHRRKRRAAFARPCAGASKSWASCSIAAANAAGARRSAASAPPTAARNLDHADERRTGRRPASQSNFLASGEARIACSSPKSPGRVVATQKVDSMVGHKLLVVEPYRLDRARPRPAGHHRAHVRGGRHGRRRRRRIRADHARLQRPADARNQEPADRHRDHRHRRHGPRRPAMRLQRANDESEREASEHHDHATTNTYRRSVTYHASH